MKVEWPGDSSYLLRENRISLIRCVVSDESYFFKTRDLPCRSLCIVGYAEAHLAFGGLGYGGVQLSRISMVAMPLNFFGLRC